MDAKSSPQGDFSKVDCPVVWLEVFFGEVEVETFP